MKYDRFLAHSCSHCSKTQPYPKQLTPAQSFLSQKPRFQRDHIEDQSHFLKDAPTAKEKVQINPVNAFRKEPYNSCYDDSLLRPPTKTASHTLPDSNIYSYTYTPQPQPHTSARNWQLPKAILIYTQVLIKENSYLVISSSRSQPQGQNYSSCNRYESSYALCRLGSLWRKICTLYHFAVIDLGKVFMIHILQLRYERCEPGHALGIFDEVFFEIHYVLVWGLFCAVNIDVPEVFILRGFNEGQVRSVCRLTLNRNCLAHSIRQYYRLIICNLSLTTEQKIGKINKYEKLDQIFGFFGAGIEYLCGILLLIIVNSLKIFKFSLLFE